MQGSLIEKIQQAVLSNPSAHAFIYKGQAVTYQQFYKQLCQYAKQLHLRGIVAGSVVGISISQSPLHCIIMLALARLGAISVPINPVFPGSIKSRIIEKYAVTSILSDLDNVGVEGVPLVRLQDLCLDDSDGDLDFIGYQPHADTPLLIAIPLLMSMSAGAREPKAIMYSHGYMIERMQKTVLECTSDSRMIPANLNFTMGYICAFGLLSLGGTVVFPDSTQASEVIKTINTHAVTHVFFSSEAAAAIDALLPAKRIAFPTLEHLRILEGTPSPALLEKLHTKFTPNFYISFGSAETGGITLATPETLAVYPTSSGRARPWVQLQIVDGADNVLPTGVIGEIRAKGALLPSGYFSDEAETRKRFRNGWFYTGDRGHLNEEGLLFLE